MSKLIRTFIAIELNKEIQEALSKSQARLKSTGADVKWVAPGNIHLTLRFLGNLTFEDIEKIKNILGEIGHIEKCFSIYIAGLGAFPKIDYPRIIWADINKGKDELIKMSEILESKLKTKGFPKADRPFSAHITIGRVRSPLKRKELASYLNNVDWQDNLEMMVDKITLFESTLTPKGPVYSPLCQVPLLV